MERYRISLYKGQLDEKPANEFVVEVDTKELAEYIQKAVCEKANCFGTVERVK